MNNVIRKVAKKIPPQRVKNQLQKVLVVKSALTPIAKRECNILDTEVFFRNWTPSKG
jgi:hypothetical protein